MNAHSAIIENKSAHSSAETDPWCTTGMVIVGCIAAVRFLLLLVTAGRYGFFGDEMYYLACAEHLDWGYVDQPPVWPFAAWLVRHSLGESLIAIRFLPALCGAAKVILTGIIAQELGARRFGMALAALATACAMIYWPLDHLFTMNTIEPLYWMGCVLVVVRIVKTGNQRLWLWFGVLAGIGMETKYSMAFFAFGVVGSLLLTPQRKAFAGKWFWIGCAVALAIWMPNIMWNVQHHWPFLELMQNIRMSGRDNRLTPAAFVFQQIMVMGPATFPVWMAGTLYLFFARGAKPFRVLGWSFLITFCVLLMLKGKDYYVAPVYGIVFAAGGLAFEKTLQHRRIRWAGPAIAVIMLAELLIYLPYAIPILSPKAFLKYERIVPLGAAVSEKNHAAGAMPHYYTWEFGWEEMVSAVARTYYSLPTEERVRTAILAEHFGDAGAVDLLGKKYGLPKVICGHQNYWLWGPHGYTGDTVIIIGSTTEGERKNFEQVEIGATFDNPYGYPWEQRPILICRHLKLGARGDLPQIWSRVKHWD